MNKNLLVIISSPSGGGKDTVITELQKLIPNSAKLVTTTTRPPRPGDQEGVSYFFVSEDAFKRRIDAGELLEYNYYAGHYYGSEKSVLETARTKYDVVFSNIEVNGKHNLDILGIQNLSFFLFPESIDILKKRIEKRGGISPEMMEERLKIAEEEIEKSQDYDFRFVNAEGKVDEVVKKIEKIIKDRQK
ncbi:MAG: guanylate kinase [Patescibacteria group bacterium]|jgi:guanylate kinase